MLYCYACDSPCAFDFVPTEPAKPSLNFQPVLDAFFKNYKTPPIVRLLTVYGLPITQIFKVNDCVDYYVLSKERLPRLVEDGLYFFAKWRNGEEIHEPDVPRVDYFDILEEMKGVDVVRPTDDPLYGRYTKEIIDILERLEPGDIFVTPWQICSHLICDRKAAILALVYYFGFPIKEAKIGVKSLKPLFEQRRALLVF